MSVENDIQNKLREVFGDQIRELEIPRDHRMFVQVPLPQVKEVIEYLKQNFDMAHLTAITATDVGDDIEVLYHFFCQGITLSLRTFVPK